MKKITTVFMMILLTAALSAQVKTRLSGICDWNDEAENSSMGGLRFELIGENLGFGLEALGDSEYPDDSPTEELYESKWQGELFVSYHLLGNDTFLDPFLAAGAGCAGQDIWSETGGSEELSLALYPSLSIGLNAVFEAGLILGVRSSYRPEAHPVPHEDIFLYDMESHQTTLQIGYQFGGREKRERDKERERYGCWKWCWCEDGDCEGYDD